MRNELGLAVRSLIKRPVLSTAVVLTVGGALAVATIAFSLVNGVLLRPLPYATPGRLVTIWERATERNRERNPTSPANFYAWSDGLTQVEGLTGLSAFVAKAFREGSGVGGNGVGRERLANGERLFGERFRPGIFGGWLCCAHGDLFTGCEFSLRRGALGILE